ncbi:MAG: hypothetical protein KBI47_06830 [Armatimonadetes bacterium]|nr:hypothetical protein [Armatimonadota bacterium]
MPRHQVYAAVLLALCPVVSLTATAQLDPPVLSAAVFSGDIQCSHMNGRPPDVLPPEGVAAFTRRPAPIIPGQADVQAGTVKKLSDMPSYTWCYGCYNTAAAMVFGYYDRHGYPNMYTDPIGNGVCPLYNEEAWPDNLLSTTWGESPLAASHMGVAGRTTYGHVDDFWYDMGSPYDPCFDSVTPWDPHEPEDCTGDWLWTSRADKLNYDGDTRVFWSGQGYPSRDYTQNEPDVRDGGHGLKLFAQSRGYQVDDVFNQLILPTPPGKYNYRGFTFDDYVAQIDAGRPVLLLVGPHVLVGYGYDTRSGKEDCFVRTTWDCDKSDSHVISWGGQFAGENHFGVTVLDLAAPPPYYRPDLLIQAPWGGDHVGWHVYDQNQAVHGPVMPGGNAVYTLRLYNNGNASDTYKLNGSAGTVNWLVKYFGLAGMDITSDITGAGWNSPNMPPGAYIDIRVEVTPDATVPPNETLGTVIVARSATSASQNDLVTAWTRKLTADLTGDDLVDSRDYGAFVKCWKDAASGGAVDPVGDLNGDGQVDVKDVDRFTQLLVSGQ